MNRTQQRKFRKLLTETAERVGKTAAGLEESVRTPTGGEAAGGISNAPLHLGDIGSEAYNQELGVTLLENETYIRDEALAALQRFDRGTFGRCESCGMEITEERLEAIPYTRYCAPCATRLQSGLAVNMNVGRPPAWHTELEDERLTQSNTSTSRPGRDTRRNTNDIFAVGTAGGGTAVGGLAGTNVGDGSPTNANLEEATGSPTSDVSDDLLNEIEMPQAYGGHSGGAVGGTPANKRAVGGQGVSVPKETTGHTASRDTIATNPRKSAKVTKGQIKSSDASNDLHAKKQTKKKK